MQKIKALFLPVAEFLREIGTGVLLLAGFNVCFAIAMFIAHQVTGQADLGRGWFIRIMEARDSGLPDFVRECAEIFNWCALATMAVFFSFSLGKRVISHIDSVRQHSLP
jgi:hypothetical protein